MSARRVDFYEKKSKVDRKYPFVSLTEAESFRAQVYPYFKNMRIRENGSGYIGFWKGTDGFHIFDDHELKMVHIHQRRRKKAIADLEHIILYNG